MRVFACMYVCTPCARLVPAELRRGVGFPGTGITDNFESANFYPTPPFSRFPVRPCPPPETGRQLLKPSICPPPRAPQVRDEERGLLSTTFLDLLKRLPQHLYGSLPSLCVYYMLVIIIVCGSW